MKIVNGITKKVEFKGTPLECAKYMRTLHVDERMTSDTAVLDATNEEMYKYNEAYSAEVSIEKYEERLEKSEEAV